MGFFHEVQEEQQDLVLDRVYRFLELVYLHCFFAFRALDEECELVGEVLL